MQRKRYTQILLVVFIFAFVNFFPSVWASWETSAGDNASLSLELYPEPPYNATFFNSDMTVTVMIQNQGSGSREFRYWISESSENLFVNGRDGVKLPAQDEIGGKENYYQSFALVPNTTEENFLNFEITVAGLENDFKESDKFRLKVSRPELNSEELGGLIENFGLSSNAETFLIPRYRRYWHPERNETGEADFGYVWLVVDGENNILINDENGKLIEENLELPWKASVSSWGEAKLWGGSQFKEKLVPNVKIIGDNSFNRERVELYFAERENKPAWVSRDIFYWTSENLVKGSLDEVPDTERVEAWVSAENGEFLSTVSDYHHYTFRYDPAESYELQTLYHCPLPSDLTPGTPLLWSSFTLVDYANVYPLAEVKYDHLGVSKMVHPIDRVLAEKMPLIKRNLVGIGMSILVFAVPYCRREWKNRKS